MRKSLRDEFIRAAARGVALLALAGVAGAQVTAIKAGRLVDPATGTIAENQVILVENGKFTAVGSGVTIPAGAEIIDLSALHALVPTARIAASAVTPEAAIVRISLRIPTLAASRRKQREGVGVEAS